jgi:hypothetical protein
MIFIKINMRYPRSSWIHTTRYLIIRRIRFVRARMGRFSFDNTLMPMADGRRHTGYLHSSQHDSSRFSATHQVRQEPAVIACRIVLVAKQCLRPLLSARQNQSLRQKWVPSRESGPSGGLCTPAWQNNNLQFDHTLRNGRALKL